MVVPVVLIAEMLNRCLLTVFQDLLGQQLYKSVGWRVYLGRGTAIPKMLEAKLDTTTRYSNDRRRFETTGY